MEYGAGTEAYTVSYVGASCIAVGDSDVGGHRVVYYTVVLRNEEYDARVIVGKTY